MDLVVDRIVNDIAVCQNLDNKLMFEIDTNEFDFDVHDGDVISLVDGKYVLNNKLKEERKKIILDKFERAKKGDL